MNTATLKPARMELKTTYDAKELLNRAVALDGMDLTSFVLGSAMEKARQVVAEPSPMFLAVGSIATSLRSFP